MSLLPLCSDGLGNTCKWGIIPQVWAARNHFLLLFCYRQCGMLAQWVSLRCLQGWGFEFLLHSVCTAVACPDCVAGVGCSAISKNKQFGVFDSLYCSTGLGLHVCLQWTGLLFTIFLHLCKACKCSMLSGIGSAIWHSPLECALIHNWISSFLSEDHCLISEPISTLLIDQG